MKAAEERVLLATCADLPDGEPEGHLLVKAFAERGVPAEWVVWDDPSVDWGSGLVAVRATWDYDVRLEEFLAWAHRVPRLLNGAATFTWNADKSYLTELAAAGVPVVPSTVSDRATLAAAVAAHPVSVVKPVVGAGGRRVEVVREGLLPDADRGRGPWLVQPLLASVHDEGETSVFVLGGRAVGQVRKRPPPGSILVHEHLGGTYTAVPLDAEATDLAVQVVEAASDLLERHLAYARVDMLRMPDDRLVVGELELVEPALYLDVLPALAQEYADVVAGLL